MEALRSLRHEANSRAYASGALRMPRKVLLFSPNYEMNSYQRNLYSGHERFSFQVKPVQTLRLDAELAMDSLAGRLVYHQHWLRELYWNAPSVNEGMLAIDRHIGILLALKSFGTSVCWTLHNFIDHDASPDQEVLCKYALREMAKVSDHIFIHSISAGELLSSHCGYDLSPRLQVLEHALYDNILNLADACLPAEIDPARLSGRRVLLTLGMIRPYKGIPDLIRAFARVAAALPDQRLHLIIAGQLCDPEVTQALQELEANVRDQVSFVGRKLSEIELAGLMRIADVSVTPYRKILTSGSYYMATTFGKPTVAPRIGMFDEVIEDGISGFLYDGSVDQLAGLLHRIDRMPGDQLSRIGGRARETCRGLPIAATSSRYFEYLG